VLWNQFFILQELDSQIDHLQEELQLATLLNDERTAHLDPHIALLRRQAASIEERLERRLMQRAEVAARLAAEAAAHYELYEQLRVRLKVRPYVVAFSGSSCPACNVVLPANLVGDAAAGAPPVQCPSCYRLLIRRDARAQQPPVEGK
jgi:predicted  nucleic acid-binding Zn-ribbon protein